MTPHEELLLRIARTHLTDEITTLEARRSDSLDFYDVSVRGIKDALEAAYMAGWRRQNP
jgi:predicted pyridoxine 5'-phosphate oxidase superfamily flavin-nucleotide-binding protein